MSDVDRIVSGEDLFRDTSDPREGWGPWRLDAGNMALHGPENGYWIDLERCTTSAQVLDWICQIADKSWADDSTLAGFVRALNEVLRPQANLCSYAAMGSESGEPVDRVAELATQAAQRIEDFRAQGWVAI